MKDNVNHCGVIKGITGNTIFVQITQQSACAECHARSMCTTADKKDKIIEVPDYSGTFHVNEEVVVCGESSLGLQAVAIAFVIPLILVFITVIAGKLNGWGDPLSATVALAGVAVNYGILYLLRDKLKKRFVFTIKKMEH